MKGTPDEYAEAFGMFLKATNEKKVFLEALRTKIAQRKVRSVLDIGAGNGDLAVPLSKLVEEYAAIEPVKKHADRLRENGLAVIESFFPCDIKKTYDLVLISHSLPWKAELYEPFLLRGYDLLSPNGELFIITYEDGSGDWYDLLQACGLPSKRKNTGHIGKLQKFIETSFTTVRRSDIVTAVSLEDLEGVMRALAFVYSDGKMEHFQEFMKSDAVRKYLIEKYSTMGGRVSFPFSHVIFEIEKTFSKI